MANARKVPMDFEELRLFYRRTLLDDIIPFWMRHAIDPAGGLNTCLRDDGTLVSRDKWLWSQWRAVWVFSTLYNRVEKRPEWLELATHIYDFTRRHGWIASVGGWALRLDHQGHVLDGCQSIYVDAFAIYGLVEYCRATNNAPEAVALLRRTAENTLRRLRDTPRDQLPHFPYPIPPGAKTHGVPMMFSLILWELGQYLDDDLYRTAAQGYSREIFECFHRPECDFVVERVTLDNREMPAPLGTAVVPGHVIEDMWFQIHILRDLGDAARINEACRLMRRHTAAGWDAEYGGLFLAIDAAGRAEVGWPFAEAKLWWPHTEALYALLLAFEYTGAQWCLDWHKKIQDYSFARYPVAGHGEWTQKLDRRGEPFSATVALPVKDPFHLSRALILCLEVLERLSPGTAGNRGHRAK
ncbi:MAG: AGE family epimerase/isomerase [Candidatus Marinimicrobia bacterium]|nr:AGE family epimerase/isomerase [Candidatus Neomarinimicrobiota bacterium]